MEDLEYKDDLLKVILGKRRTDKYSVSASSQDSHNLLFHERADAKNLVCEEPDFDLKV